MGRARGFVAIVLSALTVGIVERAAIAKVKPPEGPWTEVVTEHYDVFGNAYADHLREAAARLEQLRALLAEDGLRWGAMSGPRTVVCAFRDQRTFQMNLGTRAGKGIILHGQFRDRRASPTIVLNLGVYDWEGVLTHEGVHDAVSRRYANLPAWLKEGFAEAFRTLRSEGGRVTLRPAGETAYDLYFRSRIPLRVLFAAPGAAVDAGSYVALYRWSWGFVYYMTVARPKGAEALHRFADALNRGLPAKKSFESAIGCSYETIQEEMDTYYRGRDLKEVVLPVTAVPRIQAPKAVPLSSDQVLLRLGDIMTSGDDRALHTARDYLQAYQKRHPHDPRATAALSEIEARRGRLEAAAEGFERAIDENSSDPKVFLRAAWNLVAQKLEGGFVPDEPPPKLPESIARARGYLDRFLEMRPADASGLWLLGVTYAWDPGDPTAGIDAMRASDTDDPLDPYSLEFLVKLLVRKRDLADAHALLDTRLAPLDYAELTDRARKIVAAAEAKASAAAKEGP